MTRLAHWLAGAALLASTATAFADPVVLNLWTIDREEGNQYHFAMAKAFNESQKDIQVVVKHVQFTDMVNDLARASATGTGPDVTYVDNPDVALFASHNVLLDLKPMIDKSKIIDFSKIYSGPRSAAESDGHIWAVPRGANTLALYYNADLFKAKGLDPDKPPHTWDELYQAAKTLNDPAKNVYGLAFSAAASEEGTFQFLPWLQMAGGSYDKVNTEAGVKALQFWQKIIDEKLASPDTLIRSQWDSTGTFNAGSAAMAISGPWELPRMQGDAKFDFRVTYLPVPDASASRASAMGEGDNVILASTQHPQEAFKFLEFMHQQMPHVWNDFGFLPVYDVPSEGAKWPKDYAVFVDALKTARVRGPSPDWAKISTAIHTAIQATLTHQSEAKAALDTAQAQIDQIVAK